MHVISIIELRCILSSQCDLNMKRARFDPGFERRKVQRRHDAFCILQEKAQGFRHSVEAVLASSTELAAETCDPFCRDLLLVAALGGLEGVECLKVASGLVPEEFVAEKSTYVGRIVNSILPADKQLSVSTLEMLSSLLRDSPYAKRQVSSLPYIDSLRRISEATGTAHTAFLAPPVSRCIVPECHGESLYRHHPVVTVTVFTLNGPTPATKCSLKCGKCATIYNYSMYGKKRTEGEVYHSASRLEVRFV